MIAPTSPRDESVVEFTLRAAVAGIVFGILFGAANAYLGLRVGLTVATSIPIAVLTVALFRVMGRRPGGMILEANLAQTIGSASSSLATGTIFTIPALFLWGVIPPFWQIAGLAFLGAILGISAMVPLRRLLIVQSAGELPYPEGTACAEVLRATADEAGGGKWIFRGLAVGAGIKLAIGGFCLIAPTLSTSLAFLPKAEVALEIAPALLAVGYILGYKQSSIMVSGSLISALVLTPLIALVGAGLTSPLFPETKMTIAALSAGQIWARYVRYIGAGAVAAAGIVTVFRAIPVMAQSLGAVLRGLRRHGSGLDTSGPVPRTDRDVPGWVVLAGPAVVVLALVGIPGLIAGDMGFLPRLASALGVGIFGILFVVVSSRIVGLIGVSSNPTSGMTLVTLLGVALVFVLCGWTDPSARAAILTVGTVVCIAASKAGDISQDLKTGYLVGATPARQQAGQFLGAAFACWAVAATVLFLGKAYTFGSPELPRAPGHPDEDGDRRRPHRHASLGTGGNGSGLLPLRHPRRSPGPRLRRGNLPAAEQHDSDLPGRNRPPARRIPPQGRREGRRPGGFGGLGHDRGRGARRRGDRVDGGREAELAGRGMEPVAGHRAFRGEGFRLDSRGGGVGGGSCAGGWGGGGVVAGGKSAIWKSREETPNSGPTKRISLK